LAMVVVAPLVEETFFRGFVFAGMRSRHGWVRAAVISALVFAAAHLDLLFFIPRFLLGYLFAFIYDRSRSLWPSMILHAAWNGFALTVTYLVS
jgi:membrane protease YdiL (CAAX protease family)